MSTSRKQTRIIATTLLGVTLGIAASSHAQAAALHRLGPTPDVRDPGAIAKVVKPIPYPEDAWNYAWANIIGALRDAGRALFSTSALGTRAVGDAAGEQLF